MHGSLKFALSALIAGTAGLASATAAIDGSIGGISRNLGQWRTWPAAGAAAADPYTRAHFTAQDRLPPNAFEVLEYEASIDSEGNELDPGCTYRLEGRMPPARWWAVWAVSSASSPEESERGGITSNDAIYSEKGELMVTLSPSPQPGQWISLPDSGNLTVVMRLYNPVVSVRRNVPPPPLPALARVDCR